jgi:hypothetical protein
MKGNFLVAIGFLLTLGAQTLAANGNPTQGQRVFGPAPRVILCSPTKT